MLLYTHVNAQCLLNTANSESAYRSRQRPSLCTYFYRPALFACHLAISYESLPIALFVLSFFSFFSFQTSLQVIKEPVELI